MIRQRHNKNDADTSKAQKKKRVPVAERKGQKPTKDNRDTLDKGQSRLFSRGKHTVSRLLAERQRTIVMISTKDNGDHLLAENTR